MEFWEGKPSELQVLSFDLCLKSDSRHEESALLSWDHDEVCVTPVLTRLGRPVGSPRWNRGHKETWKDMPSQCIGNRPSGKCHTLVQSAGLDQRLQRTKTSCDGKLLRDIRGVQAL
ncbi:hypothetical protein DL546_008423 [Coniochaeta pulveracea]|uniref:Uncharacterized protein n=1 Tax=Coniochaeta pulveracea TaxID=177199 RepID=A0A420YLX6_9PEZI|nr:hypothetical protein DL546_008423 [Coniochaeta pulveracea]